MSFTNGLISLYKAVNQSGFLQHPWVEQTFVSSYFLYKKYMEDPFAKLVKRYPNIFKDGHVLDIGANIGYTSFVFSQIIGPEFKVFAFEPESKNVALFQKVLKKYKIEKKVQLKQAAVGNEEGEIELWFNSSHPADHRVLTSEFRKELAGDLLTQKVPITTIDNFLAMQGSKPISFIKIDVQGFELPVCEGMQKTLHENPNCVVAFEYCPQIMASLGFKGQELINFFQERNYHFYKIHKAGNLTPVNPDSLQISTYIDFLCSKNPIN